MRAGVSAFPYEVWKEGRRGRDMEDVVYIGSRKVVYLISKKKQQKKLQRYKPVIIDIVILRLRLRLR